MRICQIEFRNFRGIREGLVVLPRHAVLLGANNAGKSTIVEALALLFGRERMVRPISDWDFYDGAPKPDSRFYVIATITEFPGNDPIAVPDWFIGENSARPVWWPLPSSASQRGFLNPPLLHLEKLWLICYRTPMAPGRSKTSRMHFLPARRTVKSVKTLFGSHSVLMNATSGLPNFSMTLPQLHSMAH